MVKVFLNTFSVCVLTLAVCFTVFSQQRFDGKAVQPIVIEFEGDDRDLSASEQFRLLASEEVGDRYSAVKIRNALEKLYETDRIVSVAVEATEVDSDKVFLRFIIKRKTLAKKITVLVERAVGETITEQELLFRLNLVGPGTSVSRRVLEENADLILTYLRERGYYNAEVTHSQKSLGNDVDVEVVFDVKPNSQAKTGNFKIEIDKFDASPVNSKLKLQPNTLFSLPKLNTDLESIRAALRDGNYLAPRIDEPRIVYDDDKNTIDIEIRGTVGAKVNVIVNSEKEKLGEKRQIDLLPVKREGTIDYAAIVEGERRLENYFQERGFFFAAVTPSCAVTPAFKPDEASETENNTEILCTALSGADLSDREVEVKYDVNLNRRLKLVEIRLEDTDKLTIPKIESVLESQVANALGFIPFFGYGRGYTSLELLQKDRDTIESLLHELGYRNAKVGVKQGVSPAGEQLIITFVVREGIPTIIKSVDITGNTSISESVLRGELPELENQNFSRARARNGAKKLAEYYAALGYFDAKVNYSITELAEDVGAERDEIKVTYKIENEGRRVYVNRILVNGNENTKTGSILKFIDLRESSIMRSTDIFSSEQSLYATDAFQSVEIKTERAGVTAGGDNQSDIIINLEEKKPRLITYGGGYSTDVGLSGFFDIRHFNLFRSLKQGGAQIRWSQRQQLFQLDFLNPRFISDGRNEDGRKRYAPLTFTAQYQRDSTVTRFFRSTFDQGTFGIVQRIDENGVPIDEFGIPAGDPTINRFTLSAETQRTISRKDRSILFLKYRFEDVRLFNFESLLIKDLLRPDSKIRTSGFVATFVRDTRKNCSLRNTLLEVIAKGVPGDRCKYNAGDPTDGDYLTAEYSVSLPALGANIGFHKVQISYNRYYTVSKFKDTTIAARAVLGLASVFSKGQRFSPAQFPGLDGILPISERFFAGGSTTLRGFEYEAAGPRIVVVPQGIFRNQNGEIVNLDAFTIPFGGNALAIVNIEARIPVSETVRVVPFYDGGNVFRSAGEVFNPRAIQPNDVFQNNLRSVWTHTAGLGIRIKTPIGGEFAIDYGYLLNPPGFTIQQPVPPDAMLRLHQGQFHFRFSQAF